MTEADIDEFDAEDYDYTLWDIADASYNAERRAVAACIGHLRKWQSVNPVLKEAIAILEQL